jgi:hypothetical protein
MLTDAQTEKLVFDMLKSDKEALMEKTSYKLKQGDTYAVHEELLLAFAFEKVLEYYEA